MEVKWGENHSTAYLCCWYSYSGPTARLDLQLQVYYKDYNPSQHPNTQGSLKKLHLPNYNSKAPWAINPRLYCGLPKRVTVICPFKCSIAELWRLEEVGSQILCGFLRDWKWSVSYLINTLPPVVNMAPIISQLSVLASHKTKFWVCSSGLLGIIHVLIWEVLFFSVTLACLDISS